MPFDLFASARTTAAIALVGASFSSPIVLGERGAEAAPGDSVRVGHVEYVAPAEWDSMAQVQLDAGRAPNAVGTAVSGLCPGGRSGSSCVDGLGVTFVEYGEDDAAMPPLEQLEQRLDSGLRGSLDNVRKVGASVEQDDSGGEWLRYEFVHGSGAAEQHQVLGAWSAGDGTGVVAVASAPGRMGEGRAAIDSFLASAHSA